MSYKTNKNRIYLILFVLLSFLFGGWYYWYSATGGFCTNLITDRVSRDYLMRLWKAGRVTILMRHTEKCIAEKQNCPPGEALTDKGKTDAKVIGAGITQLVHGPYDLYTSKVDRARATAELGFGKDYQVVSWLREDCKQDLQSELEKPPHRNRIMITHSTCLGVLHNAAGDPLIEFSPAGHEDYGLAVFLEHPPQGGIPKVIGCLWPDDWKALDDE